MNINYKTDNPIYAPGLSTYSTKGIKGNIGDAGTSVYYAPLIINNAYAINFVNNKIKSNSLISNDTMEYLPDNRVYKAGDLIIDQIGNVYRIKLQEFLLILDTNKIGSFTNSIKINFIKDDTDYVFFTDDINSFPYEYDCIYTDNGDNKIKYNVGQTDGGTVGDLTKYIINIEATTTHIQIRDKINGEMVTFPISNII